MLLTFEMGLHGMKMVASGNVICLLWGLMGFVCFGHAINSSSSNETHGEGEGYDPSTLFVSLTLVQDAVSKGAVCLDGSPPAYNLHRGFGSGKNSWLVHMEGGGWCNNITSCYKRAHSRLGSSIYMAEKLAFSGILSNNQTQNPVFYNWNRVKIRYCDGASFTGDVQDVNQIYKLYFRGKRIWLAVIKNLLANGMNSAEQSSAKNLPTACTATTDPYQCFFPQYLLPYVCTPLFIVNAAYDSWQIKNILAPSEADYDHDWQLCKLNISNCTSCQLDIMQGYRDKMLNAFKVLENITDGGMFINSCYSHCQTEIQELWHSPDSPKLNSKTIAESVADWFFERGAVKEIDCPYPCDSTCHNRNFVDDGDYSIYP